jgi:hypothetical protein
LRWLICIFTATALLVSACGNLGIKNNAPSIAVIDWQKAMEAHPKYKRLTQSADSVERATRLRDEQLALGRKQLQLLDSLTNMKRAGKQNYTQAEFTTRMAERETAENDRLRKLERAAVLEADEQMAKDKAAIEEEYRLPIVNLRIKLESVKMTTDARAAVAKELDEALQSRETDLSEIARKRNELVDKKMAPEMVAAHKSMSDYAKELQADLLKKSMGISGSSAEQLKQGPAELEKLIASMDKQIDLKKQAHDKLLNSINSDIESALKKVTLHKQYILVLKNVRANISGVDVTDDVCTEIKNIAN